MTSRRTLQAVWIKTNLVKRNITQRDIAQELNISEGYVSLLVQRKKSSNFFDNWIKKYLGQPHWLILVILCLKVTIIQIF